MQIAASCWRVRVRTLDGVEVTCRQFRAMAEGADGGQ